LLSKPALKGLIVSLDGTTASSHNAIRGKGTFEKTSKNIKLITQHERVKNGELSVELAFVMSKINIDEVPNLINFAKELGATRLNIKNVKLIGRASNFEEDLNID